MAIWLSTGRLEPEQFRKAVLTLEAKKVRRHGFTLSGHTAPGGRTRFELRRADDDSLCATLDFDSRTKQIAVHQVGG